MQIIFEPNDLVMRQVMMRTEVTEKGFKGDVIATVVGRKHEDKDRYLNCAFLTQSGGKWHGRKYADIIVDKNLFQLPDGPRKGDIAIGDEMVVSPYIMEKYLYLQKLTEKNPQEDGKPITLGFPSETRILDTLEETDEIIHYRRYEILGNATVFLEIGTNDHQGTNFSGNGTLTDIEIEAPHELNWELHEDKGPEGLTYIRLLLNGDAEYDTAIEVCEKIAEFLKERKSKDHANPSSKENLQ